ncbi:MAG: diaminopimelate decarboxylase, partial [Saprospiraceae bacterium]|nr:diaminopimelate decarboxylase [Saprospiraceae bacterium]
MDIQGLSLAHVANEFGSPTYVYDAQKIADQYDRMVNAFHVPSLKINYACKALTNVNVLALLKQKGAGLDTVSYQEIKLGLEAGFAPADIVYTPNSVSYEEIEAAIELGVRINIDNLEYLEQIGHDYPNLPICIRFNPHVMAGGNSKISVGHIDSKFGISIHQLPLVERIVETLNINVEGIHMHTGSDILDVDVFMHATDILFGVAEKFKTLQYIDFGSGFKVPYKPNDIETNIEELGEEMSKRFNAFCDKIGKELT